MLINRTRRLGRSSLPQTVDYAVSSLSLSELTEKEGGDGRGKFSENFFLPLHQIRQIDTDSLICIPLGISGCSSVEILLLAECDTQEQGHT